MKRIATIGALIAFGATPAVAQWAGMPVWNNPKGGTGVTIDGDLGLPNSNGGKGTAFGARATLGLANISLTARSEEHTSELQSLAYLVCRLLLEKKKKEIQCYGLHTIS